MKKTTRNNLVKGFIFASALALCAGLAMPSADVSADTTPVNPVFKMQEGAGLYLEGSGIRFSATVNKKYYETMVALYGEDATFKFYTSIDKTNNPNANEELNIYVATLTADSFAEKDELTYHGIIVYDNVSETKLAKAYGVELTANAYMEVLRDGEDPVINEAEGTSESRSMRAVADYAVRNGFQSEDSLKQYYGTVTTDETDHVISGAATTYTFEDLATSDYNVAYVGMDKVGTVADGVLTFTDTAALEVGNTYNLTMFDANNNVYRTSFLYATATGDVNVERYSLQLTNNAYATLDLSELNVDVSKVTAVKTADGTAVDYKVENGKLNVKNQAKGNEVSYYVTTEDGLYVANATFVEENVKLLDMNTVIMPYRDTTWGNYSQYQAMNEMKDITQYATVAGYDWIKPATVLESSAIKTLSYKKDKKDLGWDPCAVGLSAAASFENSSEYVWGDAKYLVFDYMAFTKEGASDTAGLQLLFRTNNSIADGVEVINPGSDGYGLNFKGLSFRIYDENGNRKGFAFDEWNTFVVDLSGYTINDDFRNIIQIGINNGGQYMQNAFKNMRLVSSDEYMTDYAINDTTKYLDVMTSVTASSGTLSADTLTGAETRALTWGTKSGADTYYLDFGNSTRTTEKYFVYEMKNVDFTYLSYRINGQDLWNKVPTEDLVAVMAQKGVTLKMYKADGTETNAMGTEEWITYVWDLSTITKNITSTSFFKLVAGDGNTGKTMQLRNFRVSDTNPYA